MCLEAVPAMQEQRWGTGARDHVGLGPPAHPRADPLQHRARRLTGFLKTLAREVVADGVTVELASSPARTTPNGSGQLRGDAGGDGIRGRIGDPDDFGRIAAFLCSESAKFITGAAVNVDGGAYQGLQ